MTCSAKISFHIILAFQICKKYHDYNLRVNMASPTARDSVQIS